MPHFLQYKYLLDAKRRADADTVLAKSRAVEEKFNK